MKPLRTVIFNDSPTTRALLRAVLEASPRFEVVAEAEDGVDAAAIVGESSADLVLMDIVMPHCNGFEATRAIKQAHHSIPIVIVSAVVDVRDANLLFEVMRIGALFLIEPPPAGSATRDRIKQAAFLQTLLNVTGGVHPTPPGPTPRSVPPMSPAMSDRQADVIGMCASAGGPDALTRVLRTLPPPTMPPILLVQHLAPGFTETFARWLDAQTSLSVDLAEPDGLALPGHVYLAPEDHHLGWSRHGHLVVSNAPMIKQFRPSATFLLDSLATAGPRAIGIVLTGMGSDGAAGAAHLRERGGYLMVQSRESCAVYGMPLAALNTAGADEELTPEQIGHWLERRFREGAS